MKSSSSAHQLELFDLLRGVAILLVFGYHWHIHTLTDSFPVTSQFIFNEPINFTKLYNTFSPLAFGHVGVQLFLVISGFLIHYSYLRKGEIFDGREFFSRRFWRIYPPYILVLLFFVSINYYQSKYYLTDPVGRESLFSHLFMIHNLSGDSRIIFGINSSFWSIALEVQLYLLYPLFLYLRKKWNIYNLCWVLFIWHIVSISYLYYTQSHKLSEIAFVAHSWIIWALGALVAENYYHQKRTLKISDPAILLCILLFIVSKVFLNLFAYLSFLLAAILFTIIIDRLLFSSFLYHKKYQRIEKFIVYIGLCSYSVYLIHQPILGTLIDMINTLNVNYYFRTLLSLLLPFSIIFSISYLLYLFVELKSIQVGYFISSKVSKRKRV